MNSCLTWPASHCRSLTIGAWWFLTTFCSPLTPLGSFIGERALASTRLVIESVFSNLKDQMRLEQHLAKTPAGLAVRIAQRILALTIGILLNTPRPPRTRPRRLRRPLNHIKPLTWSKVSRGPARVGGFALGLEQRMVGGSDGGSD